MPSSQASADVMARFDVLLEELQIRVFNKLPAQERSAAMYKMNIGLEILDRHSFAPTILSQLYDVKSCLCLSKVANLSLRLPS